MSERRGQWKRKTNKKHRRSDGLEKKKSSKGVRKPKEGKKWNISACDALQEKKYF